MINLCLSVHEQKKSGKREKSDVNEYEKRKHMFPIDDRLIERIRERSLSLLSFEYLLNKGRSLIGR